MVCNCMQGKSTLTISNFSDWQQILSFHIPVCNDRGDEHAETKISLSALITTEHTRKAVERGGS